MKKIKVISGLIVALLVLVAALLAFLVGYTGHYEASKISQTVVVSDGIGSAPYTVGELIINRNGNYTISANWWPDDDPGFLTGIIFYDEEGNVVHGITAQKLMSETFPIKLKKGKLRYEITFLTSNEAADEYSKIFADDEEDISHAFEGYCDGEWFVEYELGIRRVNPYARLIFTFLAALAGFIIALILVVFSRRGAAGKYDERQLIARGVAYRYGFFTALAYNVFIAFACSDKDIELPIETSVLIIGGVLLTTFAFATVCILKDAYFAINENKKSIISILVIFGAINLFIGIRRLLLDGCITDGKVGMSSINLLCGIFIVLLLIVALVKVFLIKEDEE